MAETKHKWLKTGKLGRKIDKIWRKRGILAMFSFCTFKFYNSFLPKCQFLFCHATQFCSAKLKNFVRGGQGPPGPPPRNAYAPNKRALKATFEPLLKCCIVCSSQAECGGRLPSLCLPCDPNSPIITSKGGALFILFTKKNDTVTVATIQDLCY